MASNYGVNYTNIFQTSPSVKVDVTDWHSRVRCMFDSYTQGASALAIGDKVYMGRLPAGAKIIEAYLQSSDFGATGVVDVGYEFVSSADGANVTNGIFSAVDIHTAAALNKMSGSAAPGSWIAAGAGFAGEVNLVINVTTATDTTGGTFALVVEYVLD